MSKPLIIGTTVVVAALFALGGFVLWQMSQQQAGLGPFSLTPAEQTSPPPAPAPSLQSQGQSEIDTSDWPASNADSEATAGWQTYRNEEWGFEVMYPSKYFVFIASGNPEQNENLNFVLVKESDREYVNNDNDKVSYIRIYTLNNPGIFLDSLTQIARGVWPFTEDVEIKPSCIPQKAIGLDSLYCSFEFEEIEDLISIDGVLLKLENRDLWAEGNSRVPRHIIRYSRVLVFEGLSRVRGDKIRSDLFDILPTFQLVE